AAEVPVSSDPAGAYFTITASAVNPVGNVSGAQRDVIVDRAAPDPPIISAGELDGGVTFAERQNGVEVSGIAEPGANVRVTWGSVIATTTANPDSGAWTVDFIASQVPIGSTTLRAEAIDISGNIGAAIERQIVV